MAPVETTFIQSILLNVLIKSRRSQNVDAGWYGRSLHVSNRGEWDFDLCKKPIEKVRLHGPFFSAVHAVQQGLMKGQISLKCPVLLMCSNRSIQTDKTWRDEYAEGMVNNLLSSSFLIHTCKFFILADLVLNVKTMRRAAAMIGPQVTIYEIENAKHDIFLSKQSVREKAFDLMFRWLKYLEEKWIIIENT